jgi:uncharacterized protein
MRTFLSRIVLALALLAGGLELALAQGASPDKFAEKLATYDSAAVAAAQAYAKTFDMKGILEKSAPLISNAMLVQLREKNPNLAEDKTKLFIDTFMQSALVDNAEVIEQATVLNMLDIFSRDELIAMNEFYSSPVGAGILKKMPTLMGRMPEITRLMQTYVVPRALAEAKAKLRASGVDVKI